MAPRSPLPRTPAVLVAAVLIGGAGLLPATTSAYAAAPTCAPWQTVTHLPLPPAKTPVKTSVTPTVTTPVKPAATSVATTPAPPTPPSPSTPLGPAVCRNAPPTPFPTPSWDPLSVVGGPLLARSGVITLPAPGVPAPPVVGDVSYVVADLGSGEILAAKSPHAWLRPASTLKTLTALTLMPRLDPKRVVVAGPEAQAANGSRVGIIAGNPYPVSSLFDAMLMFSANDAVYALADAAGGYDRTVDLMNAKAAEISAHDTVTVDPSGLDEGDQRSSAYDLALIARAAMKLPAFRSTIVKTDAVFPGGTDPKTGKVWPSFHIHTINDLLTHYDGAIGVKPGRTNRAQHTFVGAATRGGRTLLVASMGSTTGSWKPTAALLDWGFAHAAAARPVGRLVEPGEAPPPVQAPTPVTASSPPAPSPTELTEPDASARATTAPAPETGTPAPVALGSGGQLSGASAARSAIEVGTLVLSLGALLSAGRILLRARGRRRR
ncbi:MAG: hypothetical protein ABIR97_04430 [Terracoccus sp.]